MCRANACLFNGYLIVGNAYERGLKWRRSSKKNSFFFIAIDEYHIRKQFFLLLLAIFSIEWLTWCFLILLTVSVACKLSKRKVDSNLHLLHRILFKKKSNVKSLSCAFYFIFFKFNLKLYVVLFFFCHAIHVWFLFLL